MKYSEKDLAERFYNDDVEAFHFIFNKNYKQLVRYAMKFVIDLEAAEDIIQQTFLYVWEKRKTLNIGQSLKSYLFRSVHNACINHLKRDKNKKEHIKSFLLEFNNDFNETGLSYVLDHELQNEIENAINELPESCQYIFRLSRFDGLKNREIANQMSISIRTVETQIYRALKFMKARLNVYTSPMASVLIFFLICCK